MVVGNKDSESRERLLTAVNGLSRSIWEPSPHRFWHDNKSKGYKFTYFCCQDKDRCRNSYKKRTVSQRDGFRMERYECESSLVLQVDLGRRFVKVSFAHSMHEPYVDIYLSPEIQEYIAERLLQHTPAEIYEQVRRNRIKGWGSVAEYQIY